MNFVNMFLNFDKLIGTALVKFIYYVGIIGIALGCLFIMFSGFQFGFLQGIGTIVVGPILAVIYLLFWRFVCEMWIVLFKISNDLGEVRKSIAGGAPVVAAPTPPPV
ncbi:MAG: DUF4282 domain-containing protein [Hyphomonadaceae bacterium]|nr:DUF4282 domain-containing protein [Hyphomonadaceae bacterium]